MKWKDCTSYSKGNKEKIPSSFEAHAGPLRIFIVSEHIYSLGEWVLSTYPTFVKLEALQLSADVPFKEVQQKAERLVKEKMLEVLTAL